MTTMILPSLVNSALEDIYFVEIADASMI